MQAREDARIISIPGERFTPFTLAKKLNARAILESASFKQGRARYSIILIDEAFRLRQKPQGVVLVIDGQERPFVFNRKVEGRELDILDALEEVAAQNRKLPDNLPIPASGIGFLGYEFVRRCDRVSLAKKPDATGLDEAEFMVGHTSIIFDHYTDTIHLAGLNYAEHSIDLEAEIARIKQRLGDLDFSYLAPPNEQSTFTIVSDEALERDIFIKGVQEIRKEIRAGNLLQAVLSRRLLATSKLDPLEAYRRLRSASPSPYLFYIDFSSYTILGSSPESLIRLKSGKASIRPIAGTRRRGQNAEEDESLSKELLADPKERAEHLMLVDLARNDLGKVSEAGSVRLSRNMEIEEYSHVMHIVSELESQPAAGRTAGDLLRSAFPAGTVSGAPKIKAMEIISQLEGQARSFYAGAIGYLDAHGGFDTAIAIRCALVKDGLWHMQAGAGIVWESKAEREWEETNEKLAALRAALSGGTK